MNDTLPCLLCPPLLSSLLLSSPLFSAQLNDTLSLICLFFTTFFSPVILVPFLCLSFFPAFHLSLYSSLSLPLLSSPLQTLCLSLCPSATPTLPVETHTEFGFSLCPSATPTLPVETHTEYGFLFVSLSHSPTLPFSPSILLIDR